MKRWSLKTSGRVLVVACVMLAGVAVNAVSQEELEAEKDWTDDEFKSFLRLPSGEHFDALSDPGTIKVVDKRAGFSGFIIITNEYNCVKECSKLLICSADISLFKVTISSPKTCKQACDKILVMCSFLSNRYRALVGTIFPEYDSTNKVYKLFVRSERFPGMVYLHVKTGISIDIQYDINGQILRSPVNMDVLMKQMDAIAKGLDDTVMGLRIPIKEDQQAYMNIRKAYLSAKGIQKDNVIPGKGVRFDLALSEAITGLVHKCVTHKPYTLKRIDGKAIPLVKIADLKSMNAALASTETGITDPEVADVVFTEHVGNKVYNKYFAKTVLNSNNIYQVTFMGEGNEVLRISLLDKAGQVVQWGEIEVDIVDTHRSDRLAKSVELGLNRAETYIKPFMRTLRIELGSDAQLPNKFFGCLASDQTMRVQDLNFMNVKTQVVQADMAGGSTNCIMHQLVFLDGKGKIIGHAFVYYAPSVREAQMALFSQLLSRSSKPWSGRVEGYNVTREGLGDWTLEKIDLLKESNSFDTNKQSVVLMQNNVAMEVLTQTPSLTATQLARMLLDLLFGEK